MIGDDPLRAIGGHVDDPLRGDPHRARAAAVVIEGVPGAEVEHEVAELAALHAGGDLGAPVDHGEIEDTSVARQAGGGARITDVTGDVRGVARQRHTVLDDLRPTADDLVHPGIGRIDEGLRDRQPGALGAEGQKALARVVLGVGPEPATAGREPGGAVVVIGAKQVAIDGGLDLGEVAIRRGGAPAFAGPGGAHDDAGLAQVDLEHEDPLRGRGGAKQVADAGVGRGPRVLGLGDARTEHCREHERQGGGASWAHSRTLSDRGRTTAPVTIWRGGRSAARARGNTGSCGSVRNNPDGNPRRARTCRHRARWSPRRTRWPRACRSSP